MFGLRQNSTGRSQRPSLGGAVSRALGGLAAGAPAGRPCAKATARNGSGPRGGTARLGFGNFRAAAGRNLSKAFTDTAAELARAIVMLATQQLGSLAGPLGSLAGLVVGLVSGGLFGGGRDKPRVEIVSYGSQALNQMRDVQGEINIFIPAGFTDDAGQLDRLASRLADVDGRRVNVRFA